jgi:hypothetical protein
VKTQRRRNMDEQIEKHVGKEPLELRCEGLGIEQLFWDHIRLQTRLDDLEGILGQTFAALVDAQTREERQKAVEVADAIETIAVHRRLAS